MPPPRGSPQIARNGTGDWATQAAWTAGLAAWRTRRCDDASDAFATVAARTSDYELAAAADYWGARADTAVRPSRAGRDQAAQRRPLQGDLLRPARRDRARHPQCQLYGPPRFSRRRMAQRRRPAGRPRRHRADRDRRDTTLADQFIRYQAKIGGPGDHDALIHLACDLNLPATQLWLAHNAPVGDDGERRRPLPAARLAAGARLARRPVARLRPCAPGIRLPHRCRQQGRRGRPAPGDAGHRRATSPASAASRSSAPSSTIPPSTWSSARTGWRRCAT